MSLNRRTLIATFTKSRCLLSAARVEPAIMLRVYSAAEPSLPMSCVALAPTGSLSGNRDFVSSKMVHAAVAAFHRLRAIGHLRSASVVSAKVAEESRAQ